MKRIMAVYDADPFYADRFAEFVNQKEAAFHAVAFTSLARLRAFSEQQRIEMLLVGDEVEEEGLVGEEVCVVGVGRVEWVVEVEDVMKRERVVVGRGSMGWGRGGCWGGLGSWGG